MKRQVRRLIKLLGIAARPLLYLVYFLSGLVPRDSSLWVFGSWDGRRMADNAKWAFLLLNESGVPTTTVWITKKEVIARDLRNMGLRAYHYLSPRGVVACVRARVYVYDAYVDGINFWTSRGATQVNLWHGVPLKKIERDISSRFHSCYRVHHGPLLERTIWGYCFPWLKRRPSLLCSTSRYVSTILGGAFGVELESLIVTGYPRNDVLFSKQPKTPLPCLEPGEYRKIICYLPTFRETTGSLPDIDWQSVESLMESHNAIMLIKLHAYDRSSQALPQQLTRIVRVAPEMDTQTLLPYTDILITDYSSVMFDYLLLDRPMVFFPFDLPRYIAEDRQLYRDYSATVPGPVVKSEAEFLKILSDILRLDGEDPYRDKRAEARSLYHDFADANSTRRLYDAIRRKIVESDPKGALRT